MRRQVDKVSANQCFNHYTTFTGFTPAFYWIP